MSEKRYCEHCGAELDSTARFCMFCGQIQPETEVLSTPLSTTPPQAVDISLATQETGAPLKSDLPTPSPLPQQAAEEMGWITYSIYDSPAAYSASAAGSVGSTSRQVQQPKPLQFQLVIAVLMLLYYIMRSMGALSTILRFLLVGIGLSLYSELPIDVAYEATGIASVLLTFAVTAMSLGWLMVINQNRSNVNPTSAKKLTIYTNIFLGVCLTLFVANILLLGICIYLISSTLSSGIDETIFSSALYYMDATFASGAVLAELVFVPLMISATIKTNKWYKQNAVQNPPLSQQN